MTIPNLFFVCALGTMVGAGFLGLGSWGMLKMSNSTGNQGGARATPPNIDRSVTLHSEAQAASAENERNPKGVRRRTVEVDAKNEFENAFGKAVEGVTFEKFPAAADKLIRKFQGAGEYSDLREKLKNPTEGFKVTEIDQKELKNFIQPLPEESFAIAGKGGDLKFVWVSKNEMSFWFSADENDKPPPPKYNLVESRDTPIELMYRPKEPTEEEWNAAREANNPDIKNLDTEPYGKGEYLADRTVIGRSDKAKDEIWLKPHNREERRTASTKPPSYKTDFSLKEIQAEANILKKSHTATIDKDQIPDLMNTAKKTLVERAKQKAMKDWEAGKEEFAYRIVIPYKPTDK